MSRVRLRDSSSWWEDRGDGRVELVVIRRVGGAEGNYREHRFVGADEPECEQLYDDYCASSYERSERKGRAMQTYGIRGYL